jgi:RNA polymerase sigma factor (sigma-70 family)
MLADSEPNDPDRVFWERRCLAAARQGDVEGFGELYDAYAARLYERVLMPLLGNAAAAEDALSETFRTAFQRLDQFESGNVSFYFWLARIARNKALDAHRYRQMTCRLLAQWHHQVVPLLPVPESPEEHYEREDFRHLLSEAVQQTLQQLNERYRQAIVLRFLQDLPREQCAEQLGVKLGTFDVLLLRALQSFRKNWEERMPDSSRLGKLTEVAAS